VRRPRQCGVRGNCRSVELSVWQVESAASAQLIHVASLRCRRFSRQDSCVQHVDVGGVRIAYSGAGSGPPLVMLHGAPADSRTWQWMLPDLSRDHTVIAWDAPGFGESSDIDDSWRAAQFADALAAFIAALGLERPHLVGHSFGTMVALSLFQRRPAVPASLVLVGGYAGWAGSLPPAEVARRLEMFLGMAELGNAFDPKSYPGLFSDLIPADRDPVLASMMRENMRPATVRAAGYIGAETDLRPVLPTVEVPTLVLHGEADARSPLANAEALHAAISTSQLVVLPKLGHACVVEEPEACAAEIRRFVKTVS
jgi:pimeloyl-ACP methyl ester carboxylesterase